MTVQIEEIAGYSDDVLRALNDMMPQLSAGSPVLTRLDLEAIVNSDASHLYLATNGAAYIGSLTLVMFKIPTGFRAWIEDVVVSTHARGQGVGELLVQHAIVVARSAGVKSIDLTSRSSRAPAIALYKKLGFQCRETNVFRFEGI